MIPFFDRKPKRNPLKRPAMMFGGFVFLTLLMTLTITGYISHTSKIDIKPKFATTKPIKLSPQALKGKNIFDTYGCISCHTISGRGGKVGPVLTNESQKGRTKNWIMTQIKNPKAHDPKSVMPPFIMLDSAQVNDLADYLLSPHPAESQNTSNPETKNSVKKSTVQKNIQTDIFKNVPKTTGSAATMIGNVAHGALLFKQDCESCHGIDGKGGVPNPGSSEGFVPALNNINQQLFNNDPQTFTNNIDRFIQHGAVPAGLNPQLKMLDFGNSHTLTQEEIANIEAYILYLNGVNRAKIEITSFSPEEYFIIVASSFVAICIIFVIIVITKKRAINK